MIKIFLNGTELNYSDYTYTETDPGLISISFTTNTYLDLTDNLETKIGHIYGDEIRSFAFVVERIKPNNNGLYSYDCMEYCNYMLQSEFFQVWSGITKWEAIKEILNDCGIGTEQLGSINNYKNEKGEPVYKNTINAIFDGDKAIDILISLIVSEDIPIRFYFGGYKYFFLKKVDNWFNESLIITDIIDKDLTQDITNITTDVTVRPRESYFGEPQQITGLSAFQIDLAKLFGKRQTVIGTVKDSTKSDSSHKYLDGSFDQWGRSEDKSVICGIGRRSSTKDNLPDYDYYMCIYDNKDPDPNNPGGSLAWTYGITNKEYAKKTSPSEGEFTGLYPGDLNENGNPAPRSGGKGFSGRDYSIMGWEKMSGSNIHIAGPREGPIKMSAQDAQDLITGKFLKTNPDFKDPLNDTSTSSTTVPKSDEDRRADEKERLRKIQKSVDDSVGEAYRKIKDGVIKLITMNLSYPLAKYNMQTNMFIYMETPEYQLKNFENIYSHVADYTNINNRESYKSNWWYVQNINITHTLNDYRTNITLSPIASTLSNYINTLQKAVQLYEEAREKADSGDDATGKMLNIPREVTDLAAKLAQGKTTNYDKLKAFFLFCTGNMNYKFYYGHQQDAKTTLDKLSGNCMDLSYFFAALCSAQNIPYTFAHADSVTFSDGSAYPHWWIECDGAEKNGGASAGIDPACGVENKSNTVRRDMFFGFAAGTHPYHHSTINKTPNMPS